MTTKPAQNNSLALIGGLAAFVGGLFGHMLIFGIGAVLLGVHCLQTPTKSDDAFGYICLAIGAVCIFLGVVH